MRKPRFKQVLGAGKGAKWLEMWFVPIVNWPHQETDFFGIMEVTR
jgi:hypothetical protein